MYVWCISYREIIVDFVRLKGVIYWKYVLKYANFEIIKQYVYKTLVWFSGFFILSYSNIKILECMVFSITLCTVKIQQGWLQRGL